MSEEQDRSPQRALNILSKVIEKDGEEFQIGDYRYVRMESPSLAILLKQIMLKLDSIDKNLRLMNDIEGDELL